MKTITCKEPGTFELTIGEKPTAAAGEVLVRIRRIGICGTDLHAFQGNQAFFSYPRVLGHELSGEIAELGENVEGLKSGDKVLIIPYLHCGECIACRRGSTNCCANMRVLGVHSDGGMREFMPVPAAHVIKCNDISLNDAALVECLAIGAHAVRRADIREGDNAVIVGAGPIGIGSLQFAKAAGATVTVVDINDDRLSWCASEFGVQTINPLKENAVERLAELTNGEYATAVIDATGHAGSMRDAVQFCAHSGKLVYVGLNKGEIGFLHTEIHKRELTLLCSRNALREDFQHVIDCLADGRASCSCMVTHNTTFDQLIPEFEEWLKPETGVIKALVEV